MHNLADDIPDWSRRSLLAMAAISPALVAAGAASATEPASAQAAELPPDLAMAMSEHEQATLGNDVAILGNLVAEDYLLVNSDSTLQNKQQYLDDFNVPGFRIDPYTVEQPMLKVWGDVALTGGLLHLGWTQDGKHQERLLRIAHVWARDDGHWRLTYTQLTRVPQ